MKFGGGAPPLFNRIRQQSIPDAIKRLLGLTAEMGTPQLAPELQFSIDLYQRPEFWSLLGGSIGWSLIGITAAGGVGLRSISAIVNPAGSGELAIVEYVFLENNAGATRQMQMALGRGGLGTPSVGTWVTMDSRKVASGPTQFFPPTRVQIQTSNSAAFAGSTIIRTQQLISLATFSFVDQDTGPIILAPGFMLQIMPDTDNLSSCQMTVRTRMRPAQGLELVL